MRPSEVAAVVLGGMLGASLRLGAGAWLLSAGSVPWATLVVNVAGSAAAGATTVVLRGRSGPLPLFVIGGLLGSLTTMATFQVELVRLLTGGSAGTAAAYGLGSTVAGLGAAWLAAAWLAARTAGGSR